MNEDLVGLSTRHPLLYTLSFDLGIGVASGDMNAISSRSRHRAAVDFFELRLVML